MNASMTCNARMMTSSPTRRAAVPDQHNWRVSHAVFRPAPKMGCNTVGLRASRATAVRARRSATAVAVVAAAKGYKVLNRSEWIIVIFCQILIVL